MKNADEFPETVLLPVMGHVGMPLPSRQERAEFIASLEAERTRIKNSEYTLFEKAAFLRSLREDYAEYLKNK